MLRTKKPRKARKYLALRGDFNCFLLDNLDDIVYNIIGGEIMVDIERALQDLANVITILVGIYTLYQIRKGK